MNRNCPLEVTLSLIHHLFSHKKIFSVHNSSFMVNSFNVPLYHQPYEEILLMSNVRRARIILVKTFKRKNINEEEEMEEKSIHPKISQ